MKPPQISFVIPALNEEKRIGVAIDSIHKLYKNKKTVYEIIVVDNGSTDKTSIIAKRKGARVVHEKARNKSVLRNFGAKSAQFKWICFLDSDCEISSELFEQVLFYSKDYEFISANTSFKKYIGFSNFIVWLHNLVNLYFRFGIGRFILVKSSVFKSVKGFSEDLTTFEDIDLSRKVHSQAGKDVVKILRTPIISDAHRYEKTNQPGRYLIHLLAALLGYRITTGFSFNKSKATLKKTTAIKNNALILMVLLMSIKLIFSPENTVIASLSFIGIFFIFLFLTIVVGINIRTFFITIAIVLFIELINRKIGYVYGNNIHNSEYAFFGLLDIPFYFLLACYVFLVALSRIIAIPLLVSYCVILLAVIFQKFSLIDKLWRWDQPHLLVAPASYYLMVGVIAFIFSYLFNRFEIPKKFNLFYSSVSMVLLGLYFSLSLMRISYGYGIVGIIFTLFILFLSVRKGILENL